MFPFAGTIPVIYIYTKYTHWIWRMLAIPASKYLFGNSFWPGNNLSILFSGVGEVAYRHEFSLSESVTSTVILYGGVDALHSWSLTDQRWKAVPLMDTEWGVGLVAGV